MDPFVNYSNRFEGAPTNECGTNTVAQIMAHRNNRPNGCLDIVFAGTVLPNDNCANATSVPCNIADVARACTFGFRTYGASNDGPAGCRPGWSDIWYRYTAPCDGQLTVTTCNSSYDTILFGYRSGAPCPPVTADQLDCNDDSLEACPADATASRISFPIIRGQSYLVRIAGYGGAQGTGIVKFENTGCNAPANDSCANAPFVGQGANIPFTTINATTGNVEDTGSAGFPQDSWLESPCVGTVGDDLQISNDVWFHYIAPCSGTTRFSTCGSTFDTKIAVYDHCPNDNNQRLGCNDDSCGLQSNIDVYLTAGFGYYVRVGGYHGAMGAGTLRIDSFQCPPPANDNCSTSNYGMSDGYTANGTTYQASRDGSATRGQESGPDVWYWYQPSCTGIATLDTCGASSDTVISIHSGCPGTIANQIAVDDDACGNFASRVSFPVVANQTYLVRVAAYSIGTAGSFSLHGSCVPSPPANDACANAIDVSGCWSQNQTTLVSATRDGSGGDCGTATNNPDVWFTYTAPYSGRLIAATCGTNDTNGADLGIDTVLSLHSGCPGTLANQILCSDDTHDPDCYQVGVARDSYIAYNIAAGDTVKIRVSKYFNSPVGPVFFYTVLQPFNDTCPTAQVIGDGVTNFCNIGAHTEYNRFPYPPADVWFRWTASCDGNATADLCGSDTNMRLVVYRDTGICPANEFIQGYITTGFEGYYDGCPTHTGKATFAVTAGQDYLIEVGERAGEHGILTMSCTANTGACCLGPLCAVLTADDCAAATGTFQGLGEPCKFPGNPVTCCTANINQAGGTSVQDIFDFLQLYFAADPRADINRSGAISVQDIFDFLSMYFVGCPE
jgi:hypothetical protein